MPMIRTIMVITVTTMGAGTMGTGVDTREGGGIGITTRMDVMRAEAIIVEQIGPAEAAGEGEGVANGLPRAHETPF